MSEILSAIIGVFGTIVVALITNSKGRVTAKERRRFVILLSLMGIVLLVAMVELFSILLKPIPYAHIVSPNDYIGQAVTKEVKVVVDYRDIPSDRYIWAVVRIPSVRPSWLVFPQLQSGKIPTQVRGSGNFEMSANLGGGNEDSGDPFNIVILSLDKDANQVFIEYSKTCIAMGACGGIPLPDKGVEILDFVTVIRE